MIKTFAEAHPGTALDGSTKRLPPDVAKRAARELEYVDLAKTLDDLKVAPGNRLHLTVVGLAGAAGVSRQSINELLRGRRTVSPEMALCLSCLFGNAPEFWLNAQRAVDLWDAAQAMRDHIARIKPLGFGALARGGVPMRDQRRRIQRGAKREEDTGERCSPQYDRRLHQSECDLQRVARDICDHSSVA